MSEVEEIRALLAKCSEEQRREIFQHLRETIPIHPFEAAINAKAEVILEALARAPDLTIRGIRGIVGEATFAVEVASQLQGWKDVTPVGNHSYDTALADTVGIVRVQVKMQRRKDFKPPASRRCRCCGSPAYSHRNEGWCGNSPIPIR